MQSVSKNPVLNIVLVVLYLLMGLFAVYWVSHVWVTSYAGDFQIYWGALEKVQAGADPYTPYQVGASFVYHPFILSIFWAFSGLMGWETAFLVWTALSVLAWIAALTLGWKMVSEEAASEGRSVQGWLPLLLLVGFGPFLETLWVGQINAFLVLSLVLCFYLERRGHPFWAGVFLAFAVVIKLIPIVLGAYFLVRRAGKLLGGLATGLGVFSLVAFFQWGAAVTVNYLGLIPALSGDFVPSIFNLSFQGVLVRLLGEGAGPVFLRVLGWGSKALLGVGLVWVLALVWQKRIRPGLPMEMAAWLSLLLMSFFSPIVWYHHLALLAFPLLVLLSVEKQAYPLAGMVILFLIQMDRLVEVFMQYPLPVWGAQVLSLYFIFRWLVSQPSQSNPSVS